MRRPIVALTFALGILLPQVCAAGATTPPWVATIARGDLVAEGRVRHIREIHETRNGELMLGTEYELEDAHVMVGHPARRTKIRTSDLPNPSITVGARVLAWGRRQPNDGDRLWGNLAWIRQPGTLVMATMSGFEAVEVPPQLDDLFAGLGAARSNDPRGPMAGEHGNAAHSGVSAGRAPSPQ